MATTSTVESLVSDFTAKLKALHESDFRAKVMGVLGNEKTASVSTNGGAKRGRPKGSKNVKTNGNGKSKAVLGSNATDEDKEEEGGEEGGETEGLTKAQEKILAFVSENPGKNIAEIAVGIREDSADIKAPVAKLIASKSMRKEGVKRGTKYYPNKE